MGCPTISIVIDNQNIQRALLNLGASVNLLPFTVYKRLGLAKLKPRKMVVKLTNHSIKLPRGMA